MPNYLSRLLAAFGGNATPASPVRQALDEPLTERELEVLRLVAAGLSNRQIARGLVVSVSTVKTHINHIYRKLDVHSRTQAVVRGRELALLQAPSPTTGAGHLTPAIVPPSLFPGVCPSICPVGFPVWGMTSLPATRTIISDSQTNIGCKEVQS